MGQLNIPQGFKAGGNNTDGWMPTQYKVIDVDGVIGKKKKGVEYYIVSRKVGGVNLSIVDISNDQLKGWNNVRVNRFDDLIKGKKIKLVM